MSSILTLAAAALPACMVAFMVANLAAIGLELELKVAVAPLRNLRFVTVVLLLDWVLGPAFAVMLVRIMPLAEPYALGLILIGLAPAAPFLPMMVRRASGDLGYAAGFMLISAVATVVFMPIALPLLAPGLGVTAWVVARPLIALLLLPFTIGLVLRAWLPAVALRLVQAVKRLGDAATLAMLLLIGLLYWRGFVEAIGSYAIATQFLYVIGTMAASWGLARGMKSEQRSVVVLGAGTRNLGAALAPLLAVTADSRATVMIALGVPITLLLTALVARRLSPPAKAQAQP
jgi:bile acid:Na+ symporter, BASS family